MADTDHVAEPKNFAPKTPVNLDPPKDDPISQEELSKCDGMPHAIKKHIKGLYPPRSSFSSQDQTHQSPPLWPSKAPSSTSQAMTRMEQKDNITVSTGHTHFTCEKQQILDLLHTKPPPPRSQQKLSVTLTHKHTVFAGKDPSRALATSSLKEEDCVPEWSDLEDKYKTVLSEWFTFFSKRYNIVGKVQGATNV